MHTCMPTYNLLLTHDWCSYILQLGITVLVHNICTGISMLAGPGYGTWYTGVEHQVRW